MITKTTREVFYAPTANKHYFTLLAAIRNEAKARVSKRIDEEGRRLPYQEYNKLVLKEMDAVRNESPCCYYR